MDSLSRSRFDLACASNCLFLSLVLSQIHACLNTVRPNELHVGGPTTPVVAGEMVSLNCRVDGARPAATIVWFNRSEEVQAHPSTTTHMNSDGTYR